MSTSSSSDSDNPYQDSDGYMLRPQDIRNYKRQQSKNNGKGAGKGGKGGKSGVPLNTSPAPAGKGGKGGKGGKSGIPLKTCPTPYLDMVKRKPVVVQAEVQPSQTESRTSAVDISASNPLTSVALAKQSKLVVVGTAGKELPKNKAKDVVIFSSPLTT